MSRLAGALIIPDAKIVRYLLDATHPIGRFKADFFGAFGFRQDRAHVFAAALLKHADDHPIHGERAHGHGINRVVRGPLESPDRRDPVVDVIWFQATGSTTHRLITVYPALR